VKNKETHFLSVEYIKIKELLDEDPYNLFSITNIGREKPQIVFVDEVQYLDNPSNFLKLIYDMFNENLKLVVS
jgi:predicted AAA+ superfamily ATPase